MMTRLVVAIALAFSLASVPTVAAEASVTSCVTPRDYVARSTPAKFKRSRVWLYGDSITFQTWRDLRRSIPSLAVDARWGRSTASAVTALEADLHHWRRHRPDVVVMATGTNDLQDPDAFAEQVHRARTVVPRRVRLLWVNTYVETTDTWTAANRIITAHPRIGIVPWARANLDRLRDGKRSLLADGIHVTNRGCSVRNDLIRRKLSTTA